MICPGCKRHDCRRSRRKSLADYAIGLTGLRPWRCRNCEQRFFAWKLPLAFSFNTHCRTCGNLRLQRISKEYVNHGFRTFWRVLGAPAYRCDQCRSRFFSVLPLRREFVAEAESPGSLKNEAAGNAK